jgi:hypothetical protein
MASVTVTGSDGQVPHRELLPDPRLWTTQVLPPQARRDRTEAAFLRNLRRPVVAHAARHAPVAAAASAFASASPPGVDEAPAVPIGVVGQSVREQELRKLNKLELAAILKTADPSIKGVSKKGKEQLVAGILAQESRALVAAGMSGRDEAPMGLNFGNLVGGNVDRVVGDVDNTGVQDVVGV